MMGAPLICGGCRTCCLGTPSLLLERGDDASLYETITVAAGQTRLKPREDGGRGCRYVTATGCAVHDHKPTQCRRLDCRDYAKSVLRGLNRTGRREILATHPHRATIKEGLRR